VARFIWDRRTAFILALGVSLMCCSAFHRSVYADGNPNGVSSGIIGDPADPIGGSNGDPDLPSGPGKTVHPGKSVKSNDPSLGSGALGDTRVSGRVLMMWRIRVALLWLRGFYFRF